MLPTELVNRFRSKIIVLPQLGREDYLRMLDRAEESIPQHLRKTFRRLGLENIDEAIKNRQGCRFVEEVFLDALIAERSLVTASRQGPNP